MMSHPGSSTGCFYKRYSVAILAGLVFLLPLTLVGALKARSNNRNDVKGWLPPEYPETATYKFFRDNFEGEEFILVSWRGCTDADPRLEMLAKKLLPPPEEASRIERPVYFRHAETGPRAVSRMVKELKGLRRDEAVDRLEGALFGPHVADVVPGTDDDFRSRQTCLVLTLYDTARNDLHGAIDTIKRVATDECGIPADELHLGGPPVDNVSIDDAGQQSVTILFALSLVVGGIVSWFSLRSPTLVALVLASGVYSMFASLAVVWYSGYPVDAILLTMPSLVYVAATSGAIHLANYYRDQIAETGVQEGAAGRSVHHALVPLTLATGTTAVGLATLAVSELVPIKMFGIFSAIGVVCSFVILVTLIPAGLELFPPRLKVGVTADEGQQKTWRPIEESRWWRVGQWITRHHAFSAAACLAVMAAVGWGMSHVESSVQLMRLFSPNARIRTDYKWLEANLGPLVPMEILVCVDEERCKLNFLKRMQLVSEIRDEIDSLDEVGSSLSTVTFGPDVDSLGGSGGVLGRSLRKVVNERLEEHRQQFLAGDYLREADVTRPTEPRAPAEDPGVVERAQRWLGLLPAPPPVATEIRREQVWRISARVSAVKEVDYALFKEDLQQRIEPILADLAARGVEGITVEYTGLVPLVYKAQHKLLDGLIVGFISDFAIIVLVMILLCRAVSAGPVLLLPAAFPAVMVFGAMGWGHELFRSLDPGMLLIDIGTVMAPSVALGVTVDDVVHFMLWFRRGIADGLDRREATLLAYKGCARAMIQSWGVIGIGLFVFSLSPFGPTRRFGFMMLSMLTIALVGNLVFLPALLSGPLGSVFGWAVLRNERKRLAREGQRQLKVEPGSDALPEPHVRPSQSKQVVHA